VRVGLLGCVCITITDSNPDMFILSCARQAKQRLVRGASDAQVITAAQTLQMLEAAEKAAPAAAAAGGKKRGRPPADADKGELDGSPCYSFIPIIPRGWCLEMSCTRCYG
jgi:hypothetical protein